MVQITFSTSSPLREGVVTQAVFRTKDDNPTALLVPCRPIGFSSPGSNIKVTSGVAASSFAKLLGET